MSADSDRILKLEKDLSSLTEAYNQHNKELVQLKTGLFQTALRFEAMLRYMISGKTFSMEQFLFAMEEYNRFRTKLVSLLKEKPQIIERVKEAEEYNKDAHFKLYADDLELLNQIEASGGTSPKTAELISGVLPSSERFKLYMKKFLTVPDVVPDSDPPKEN